MKKLSFVPLLILFFTIFQLNIVNAQIDEDLFSFMAKYLTADEKSQVEKAESYFGKGDNLSTQIKMEASKIKKYSKKKKKYEKKSYDLKVLKIKQAIYYEKGYSALYNVYGEKVGEGVFLFDDDQARVNNLQEGATSDMTNAKNKLKRYKKVKESDLTKVIKYSKLKGDLKSALKMGVSSVNKFIEAYAIYIEQENKKQLEDEEKRVWQNALSENSAQSFQNYIDEYPSGQYAAEARQQISDLEEAERQKTADLEKERSMTGTINFHVQIAASKKVIPTWRLKRYYRGSKKIISKHYDVWYKYSIGDFKTYEEAKRFVKKVKVRGAFVVAYRNNEKIDIKEAIPEK